MKILVLSAYTVEIEHYSKISTHIHKKYCDSHQYEYIIERDDNFDKTRPYAWSKILFVQKYLKNYDYVVWLDADTLILNHHKKLEDIIKKYSKYDIIFSNEIPEWGLLNTGVFFVKNTDFSYNFLSDVYNQTDYINSRFWEQDAIKYMLENNTYDNIVLANYREFNNNVEYLYNVKDDFILHIVNIRDANRPYYKLSIMLDYLKFINYKDY